MEQESSPPRDTPEQTPLPSGTGVPEHRAKSCRSTAIDMDFMSQVRENASSVLEFSRQWEEYDEEMRLAEETLRKRAVELQKKEERLRMVEERERKLEESITERLSVLEEKEKEANKMRLVLEEMGSGHKAKEKLLQDSMMKKHEELMRELQVRKQELEARENELEKKEEKFQLKQKSEARGIEEKSKLLKLKEKVLEEREKVLERKQKECEEQPTTQAAETSKRSRHESEPLTVADKGRDADSHLQIGKKQKPVRDDDGSRKKETEVYEVFCVEEDPEQYSCPDPDFSDFNNRMSSLAVDQVWALYDPLDHMPRYYAQIKRVLKPQLSVEVTWLESENEEETPIACGGFRYGDSEIQSLLTLSHEMHPIRKGKKVTTINPRKGETWALFRDWTESWSSHSEQHKPPYSYDFVEVETDFDSDQGVGVSYLRKVEGFTSVYNKLAEQQGLVFSRISSDQMLRFSHRVPSFKLTGDEKERVPAGSFELDPAAVPRDCLKAAKVKEEMN
ncbi:LOW QUALITY PROTEIN: trichohyalin [Eutrema salsugineum]|uniref:LOW QUALITY PROTEIN: trichohyalin n=1 Tax=Eutrema salsugineum TaxID=72664 RepID=UPI000CECEBEC|nr:LOW QUALITY PROTEIN: trichohyalin [Eutrema salsugineum]